MPVSPSAALGGNCWASVNNFRVWSRPALYEKRCEITVVVIWRYINKIEIEIITFVHLADTFIQSDLQLLYMSEVARLWSNEGLRVLLRYTMVYGSQSGIEPESLTPKAPS